MSAITFSDFRFQGEEINALRRQIEEGRLVHALLISGEAGTGKRTLAKLLAAALLCESEARKPCGECSACRLAMAGEHPDITIIEKGVPLSKDTAKGRSSIPVDDIREMIRLCSQYSFEGGNRIVIIQDAENMTTQAQNCLLKILEEPPEHTFFLLTSGHPDQLLTTIRSRCRPVKLIPWESSYIQNVLTGMGIDPDKAARSAAASFGSIGNALRIAADDRYWKMREDVLNAFFRNAKRSEILTISTSWKDRKSDADLLFNTLEDHIRQLLLLRFHLQNSTISDDYPAAWQRFAAQAPLEQFAELTGKISEARRQNAYNVNFQAIIEQLLFIFSGVTNIWEK